MWREEVTCPLSSNIPQFLLTWQQNKLLIVQSAWNYIIVLKLVYVAYGHKLFFHFIKWILKKYYVNWIQLTTGWKTVVGYYKYANAFSSSIKDVEYLY